ncbi:MAG: TetR/AcrR family transcriptional regulator [Candidatus Delongbacteria bacterium]|jgi:AcrR family transcriptional regulator|nr:TetR/AcrR family transcriptional regulator [Candidatus Delongbacteria bacterium]
MSEINDKSSNINTKEKIVKIALKLFLKNGFYNVSMQNVADEIGISKPAIYHHFKNKDMMVEAVLDYFSETMGAWSKEYFKRCKSDIKQFLKKSFGAIYIYKNVEKILLKDEDNINSLKYTYNEFLLTISKYSDKYKDRISHDTMRYRTVSESVFKKGQERGIINSNYSPVNLAMMNHSMIEGMSFIAEVDSSIDVKKESKKLFEIFWEMISS